LKDKAVKMVDSRKSKYFHDVTDSDVMEEIITDNGLTAQVEATSVQHKELVQYNAMAWDFIVTRAEANGMVVMVEDGIVKIAKPDASTEPVALGTYGQNLHEFEGEMDARNQENGLKAVSWSYANQESTEAEATEPTPPQQGNITGVDEAAHTGFEAETLFHSGHVDQNELQAWADAALLKSRLAKLRGRAKIQGNAAAKPGTVIQLAGLGDRFNGNAYVSAVHHNIGNGSWWMDVQFGLDPEWFATENDVNAPLASAMLPAIHGLQVGLVTDLEDPDGEDRVQVKLPVIDNADTGIWARQALLYAGSDRSSYFKPEVGDEVIVGFLNDDPRDAVILGAVHSSANPAPYDASNDNFKKGLVTASGLKMEFDDDRKMYLLETPAGSKIDIDDSGTGIILEDRHGNKIEMSSGGITISSASNLELKAVQDVKMQGINVETKAAATYKAEGTAGAEVSTSAILTLKGSLVKIN
jgi:Rhs element Vgr protein